MGGVIAVAALATSGIVFFGSGTLPPAPVQPAVVALQGTVEATWVTVHVSGAVAEPGLVGVIEGSRVADVIAAAGGSTAGSDLSSINLAAPVRDGDRVVVPEAGSPPAVGAVSAEADGWVRLNTASAGELEALPGVGPVLAARIVAHREAFGPFAEVEDLLDVAGIGEAKLAALRESVIPP